MQAASLANRLVETETENVCMSLTNTVTKETESPEPSTHLYLGLEAMS